MIENFTALYSKLDIEYAQAMSGKYEDISLRDNDCEIIAGLKDNKISGFWRPVVAVGNPDKLEAWLARYWSLCNDIIYLDFLENGNISYITKFLLKQGYTAKPCYTQAIDLTKTVEELHADLRKSYKSLVNKEQVHNCTIKPLKDLHLRLKGRTRPDITWEIQERMRISGQAFVLASGKVGMVTLDANAAALIYYNRVWAYYASGCSEGKSHHILWAAILRAKEFGCKWFEMGEQKFSGDEKEVNISKFKRGFGGETKIRLLVQK